MGDGSRRLLLIVAIAALVITGTLVSRIGSTPPAAPKHPAVAAASSASLVAPLDVSSTAWYCVAGGPLTLVLTSSNPKSVYATISWNGQPIVYTTVPAGGQQEVSSPKRTPGPQSAAIIVHGGGVAVGEYVATGSTWSVGQCASSTSTSWYFPQGNTVAGNSVTLDVYNPSVTPAVVNITLVTQGGEQSPSTYQGLAVGAGDVLSESVDQHATNDSNVAVSVTAASGSVVAEELQYTAVDGVHGYSDQLGAPALESSWAFPYCAWPIDGSLTLNVLNPGARATSVTINADYGAGTPISPVTVPIPEGAAVSIALNQEPGFASRNVYSVVVRSRDTRSGREGGVGEDESGWFFFGFDVGYAGWDEPLVGDCGARTGAPLVPGDPNSFGQTVKITVDRTVQGTGASASVVTEIDPGHVAFISSSVLASYDGSFTVQANGPIATELGAKAADPGTVVVPAYALP